MWHTIKRHQPHIKLLDLIKYSYAFWKKMRLLEILREKCLFFRAYETKRGSCSQLYKKLRLQIMEADTISEMSKLKKHITQQFVMLPKDMDRDVIKIGVVGEFFLLLDSFSTLNIEEILGEMGVALEFSESLSKFLIGSVKQIRFLDKFFPTKRYKINQLAKPFINRAIGGHALQTIGHTIHYKKQGFDAVILLYPFTCMPEITANAILPKVGEEYNIPILALCFDEQTGIAGMQTRLEAFVDMIKRKV